MYKPSRLTAGAFAALQILSLDLYATHGKATACKLHWQARQAEKIKHLHRSPRPTVTDDAAIDVLEHTTFPSADKQHNVQFWRDGKNVWRATVTDAAFGLERGDFSVKQTDVSLQRWALAQDSVWQRQKLHVLLHDNLPDEGIVLIGSVGLKGGGLWRVLLTALAGLAPTQTTDKGLIGWFEGPCPDGWEAYGNLTGRVPVGAGSYTGTAEDGRTEAITYVVGDMGGEIEHKLIIDEMPSHTHKYNNPNSYVTGGTVKYLYGYQVNIVEAIQDDTVSTGGDQSHNNMQPHLVLNPCRKTKADNYTDQSEFLELQQRMSKVNGTFQNDIADLQNDLASLQQELLALKQQVNATASPTPNSDSNRLLWPWALGGLSAGLSMALCSVGACWYKNRQVQGPRQIGRMRPAEMFAPEAVHQQDAVEMQGYDYQALRGVAGRAHSYVSDTSQDDIDPAAARTQQPGDVDDDILALPQESDGDDADS